MARFFETPADWHLRMFASGNWREFYEQLQPLIKERIQVARCSAQLNGLLRELRQFVEEKVRRYGQGNITFRQSTHLAVPGYMSHDQYVLYLVLQYFTTILNDDIDKEKMDEVLPKRCCQILDLFILNRIFNGKYWGITKTESQDSGNSLP
ncbi:hypothetical protein DL766_003268 [Monosporascus sp. MC13-8B]|uniref:Cullin N-terminal domain-containing protein n=1 Tax=Monosporascus cannonballus TaxID=155416 RepID=A0ABY0HFD7_9PEZI|nr:hypothetical protein DL762_003231 [Monosporascus cannonballus]RYP00816.1 hypothetical protein DL763_000541 [Monosporascus cannonballus]RYP33827.1 hypothetical protein DL766_003268 [Monosporascus sp. MC13-8B]